MPLPRTLKILKAKAELDLQRDIFKQLQSIYYERQNILGDYYAAYMTACREKGYCGGCELTTDECECIVIAEGE